MKDFIQKSEFSETEELHILSNIFSTLNKWACPGKPLVNSEKLISLSIRHDELLKQHSEILAKIDQLNIQIEVKTAETNGFSSLEELEEVVLMLKNKLARVDKGKDGDKIVMQLQELTNLAPQVKKIEALVEKVQILESEKEALLEYIQETRQLYEELVKKA